ncbi:tyrosine-type recombinase/integrase [Phyllobacterium sp. SYP-B3895]|uniref:tyrosine-type recombinase/integrase n=1 Tax=Phyllobacterium sp. SYP-B3895 TaxID=2663240 RepID=UPI001299FF76|nr:tyrosine-type recombinase/integrase [Phyllobacterium sp. SYP-B3895]MRG55694.1 tyrosine-type recombinase/integrase [Phyllobacterium sp. SYP-B3895]
MPVIHLDDTFAKTVQRPERGHVEYTDDKISGFVVRVYSDRIVGTYRYKALGSAKKKRAPLDEHPHITMAKMRANAEIERGRVRGGADPAAERETIKTERKRKETEEVLTIDKVVELYTPALKERKDTWDQDLGHLKRNLQKQFGSTALADVTKPQLAARIQEVRKDAPVSANRLRAAMLTFFQWCVDQGLLQASPMIGIPKAKERKQEVDRTLSDAELVVLWRAIDKANLAAGVKAALHVLALTGQRPAEISGLELKELHYLDTDEAYADIPAHRMKARRRHVWPISKPVAAIIKREIARQQEEAEADDRPMGEYIFASRFLSRERVARHSLSQALRRIIPALDETGEDGEIVKRLKADPPTPHAFRRTMVTGMARLRIPKDYRKAVVAHVDDDTMAQHYDAHDLFDEKKMALDTWARHVQALLSGEKQTGAVIPLRARS